MTPAPPHAWGAGVIEHRLAAPLGVCDISPSQHLAPRRNETLENGIRTNWIDLRWPRRGPRAAAVLACLTALLVAGFLASSPAMLGAATRKVVHPKVIRHWVPAARTSWQWELDHPLSLRSAADMGTSGTLYTGPRAAAPQVYDIDGFDNTAAVVNALHRAHKRVICYLSVGTWEGWRADAAQFPTGLLGSADPGWTNERYLDVSPAGRYYGRLQAIMYRRLLMCHAKHFDGVEFDNMDVAENNSGFAISIGQDNAYVRWLAAKAHALGMAAGQKNYFDQAGALVRSMDFMVSSSASRTGPAVSSRRTCVRTRPCSRPSTKTKAADPAAYCPSSNRPQPEHGRVRDPRSTGACASPAADL